MRTIKPLLVLLSLLPSLAFAQMSQTSGLDDGSSPFRVFFGLMIVLGVIGAFAWIMKRFNNSKISGHSVAKIVGGVNLGSRERLVVVELAGHWIVAGVTPGNINALGSFKMPDIENPSQGKLAIATNETTLLAKNDEIEAQIHTPIISKSDRFRFVSRPVISEVQPEERVLAMSNPVFTEIFKRLLKK